MEKTSFSWSLKPTDWIARFPIWSPLISINTTSKSVSCIFIFVGFCTWLANILINGPRGINITNFAWMNEIKKYENPLLFFKQHADAVLQFFMDVTSICFFVSIPLIQLNFPVFIHLLSNQFKNLVFQLLSIQNEFNLSETFQKTCRQRSVVALLIGILVSL